jgi:hypothetical protein
MNLMGQYIGRLFHELADDFINSLLSRHAIEYQPGQNSCCWIECLVPNPRDGVRLCCRLSQFVRLRPSVIGRTPM